MAVHAGKAGAEGDGAEAVGDGDQHVGVDLTDVAQHDHGLGTITASPGSPV